jgi:hypothetical protein
MFLAAASQVLDRQEIFKAQLKYTLYMVTIMPIIAWSIFVLPGW